MLNTLIETASIIRNRYRFEIDGKIDAAEFFKAKFLNDLENNKKICSNLYKKLKK